MLRPIHTQEGTLGHTLLGCHRPRTGNDSTFPQYSHPIAQMRHPARDREAASVLLALTTHLCTLEKVPLLGRQCPGITGFGMKNDS